MLHTMVVLVIVHCRTEGMPSAEEVNEGNLNKALRDQRYVIISYVTSFVTVGELSQTLEKPNILKSGMICRSVVVCSLWDGAFHCPANSCSQLCE